MLLPQPEGPTTAWTVPARVERDAAQGVHARFVFAQIAFDAFAAQRNFGVHEFYGSFTRQGSETFLLRLLRSMEPSRPQLVILANAPHALSVLFGISLLERLLRVVQRLGFREAIILSNSPDEIRAHLTKPSWARAEVALVFAHEVRGPCR